MNPNVVHQRAITPRRQFAVEVQEYTARRDMIVSQAVDVALLDRRDAEIVSAMIPRRRHAVLDLVLFGLAIRAMSAVRPEVARIPPLRSVVRTAFVRRGRHVARTNVVDPVDTVDRMGTARLVPFLQGPLPRRMLSLRLL